MNILMVSLGCDKSLCDSEVMLGLVRDKGYNITNDEKEAEVIIINTCTFIHDAMQESINTILEMAELKKTGSLKYLIIAGCLSQRFKKEIKDELPEVDACLGTTSFDHIVEVIEALRTLDDNTDREVVECYEDINRLAVSDCNKVITSSTFMGYMKIAEGCNKYCSYCIIPHIRGHFRSVPMDKLIKEAKYLAVSGIKEVVLVAQETTCYGMDIYGRKMLTELIKNIAKIPEIQWIRVLYCYPEEIDQELIDLFATEKKLCHYLDLPIQHCNDTILSRMGRKTNKKSIIEVIGKLRQAAPDIALRTSLITGFPGETEEQHQELLEFIDEIEFDRLGAFTYSREEGTRAADFPSQVDEEQKKKWRDDIMELQQEISLDKNYSMIGRDIDVIIEGYSSDEDVYVGRSYRDAPSVDGYVFVKCDYELISGSIINVHVVEASEYDLIGEINDEFTE